MIVSGGVDGMDSGRAVAMDDDDNKQEARCRQCIGCKGGCDLQERVAIVKGWCGCLGEWLFDWSVVG